MKRIIAFLIAISTVLSCMCAYAEEDEITADSQTIADDIAWEDEEQLIPETEKTENIIRTENGFDVILYNNNISREEFLRDFDKEGRPELHFSDEDGDESNIETVSFGGKACFFLKGKTKYLYGKASKGITPETRNIAVKVTFYDRYIDYVRYTYTMRSGSTRNVLICKDGTNQWKTETILINDADFNKLMKYGTDFYINSYESSLEMGNDYIADIEFINLDTSADDIDENGDKKNIFQQGTLRLMSEMGFFDKETKLNKPARGEEAARVFAEITGRSCNLYGDVSLKEVLKAYSDALGVDGENKNDWVKSGIVKNLIQHPQRWFGTATYKTQNHGLFDCEVGDFSRTLYYDDLVGIAYNLLFMREDGESFLAGLAAEDEFFERMTSTNDRNLVYKYYYEKGFKIKETEREDSITGETIHEFYLPGSNINIPYINELSTVDNVNYVFCAGLDKQVNKGYPVVYNRETKETVTVDFEQMDKFAMALSEGNILYYIVGSELRSYNINSGEKKTLWQEENGCILQEIPTITRDGRYVCIFWGANNKSYPDHIGVFDTEAMHMNIYLDEKWVNDNLYGPEAIYIGHIIINPEDETLIQFLHGGPNGVEDRMWFLDTKSMKTWEAPYTARRFDGGIGELCVHWVWSYNGRKLYYIRMSGSLAVPSGIVYYDMDNPHEGVQVVNSDYPYTHAVPSYDDSLIVADTLKTVSGGFYRSEVVLYDYVSDTARLLAFNTSWSGHPCHSHPIFSLDAGRILFNSACEKDATIRVGMIEVSDIAEDMRKNGNIKHYQTANVVFDKEISQNGIRVRNDIENGTAKSAAVDGEPCLYIDNTTAVYADVDGQYIKSTDNRIKITVTYFDNGEEPFLISYNTNMSSEVSGTKNSKVVKIPKRNTNKWVRRTLTVNDACFRSAISGSYDFTVTTQSETENVYIKSIEAAALK